MLIYEKKDLLKELRKFDEIDEASNWLSDKFSCVMKRYNDYIIRTTISMLIDNIELVVDIIPDYGQIVVHRRGIGFVVMDVATHIYFDVPDWRMGFTINNCFWHGPLESFEHPTLKKIIKGVYLSGKKLFFAKPVMETKYKG